MRVQNSKELDSIFKLYSGYYNHTPTICCYKKYNNFYVAICKGDNKYTPYSVSTLEKTTEGYVKRHDISFPIVSKNAFPWIIRLIINTSIK